VGQKGRMKYWGNEQEFYAGASFGVVRESSARVGRKKATRMPVEGKGKIHHWKEKLEKFTKSPILIKLKTKGGKSKKRKRSNLEKEG